MSTRKCQQCGERDAEWTMHHMASAWASFVPLGEKYHGQKGEDVCDDCKKDVQRWEDSLNDVPFA